MYEELNPSTFLKENVKETLVSEESLRRDLESELSLDSSDIRSYAWYHGRLPRDISEELLKNNGDFLIRESISSSGEHVLSMKWGTIMHFKINKLFIHPSPFYSKVQYRFERDSFDSIPALIMYHIGNNIPISEQTGAIIRTPINRDLPLSYSEVKYASLRKPKKQNGACAPNQNSRTTSDFINIYSPNVLTGTPAGFVLMNTTAHSTTNMSSSSQTSFSPEIKQSSSPNPFPIQLPATKMEASNKTHPDQSSILPAINFEKNFDQNITTKTPLTLKVQKSNVPPKPSRIPSFRKPVIKHESKRVKKIFAKEKIMQQSENLSNLPAESKTTKLIHQTATETNRTNSETFISNKLSNTTCTSTSSSRMSMFNPFSYYSGLLPEQNKPIDNDAMQEIKKILSGTDPFKLARHMTYVDCQVCRISESGLEEIFLPKGKQFRKDLLERYQCTAFWVALCVLRRGSTKDEKIDMLNVFIQVANELIHSLGNIYGFSSIMHGLTSPQVRGLDDIWGALQQQYTNNAVTMENKLIPLMRLLDEGRGRISNSSTCIPHILPLLRYFENPLEEIPHSSKTGKASDRKQLSASEGNMLGSVASEEKDGSNWWENFPDDSFDSLMAQLSLARGILSSLKDYKLTAMMKFKDFEKNPKILEVFNTDFQLRLLWGFKGSDSPQRERFEKFDKVLTLIAKRL